MAKLTLDNVLLAEEYFEDAHLLSMQCPLDPHRAVWCINRQMGFNFRYENLAELEMTEAVLQFKFPIFTYTEQHLGLQHTLYTNKIKGKYLLPELKHTDFIWMIKGDWHNGDFIRLLEAEIRNIPQMQMVTTIGNEKIKNKQNLVL